MEYMRGWRALFADPSWGKKMMVGALLILSSACVPILGQVVLAGYFALALRRAVQGQDSLPRLDFDFDYLGKLLGVGFKPAIAQLIWALGAVLPIVAVFACLIAVALPMMQAGDGGEIAGAILLVVAMIVYVVAIVAAQIFANVALIRASLIEDLGTAIRPKGVFAMSRLVMWDLLIGHFIVGLIGIPLILAGSLFFFIGMYAAAIVVMHLQTFVHAETYRRYLEKGGEPLPVGALDVEEPRLAPAPVTF